MPNRLADQTSPYLLQHQNNPVDWYPWGAEALEAAAQADRPIFLSIGYAACHWCHVMEHESFESGAIAALLNASFIAIKVDREERPDLDQVYMEAVQVMTRQSGGWPLSIFLTPEVLPFFGGTYWPPETRGDRPGFADILRRVAMLWKDERVKLEQSAHEITAFLRARHEFEPEKPLAETHLPATPLAEFSSTQTKAEDQDSPLARAAVDLWERFDPVHGGFGEAPKFPHALELEALLVRRARLLHGRDDSARPSSPGVAEIEQMISRSLYGMALGGLRDHLAGGFARYSVDEQWLIPHFEKMLYDNALLGNLYLRAGRDLRDSALTDIGRSTLDYLLYDMRDLPADGSPGGFHSSEDADTEGVEGKTYLWTIAEIRAALGNDDADRRAADRFLDAYGMTEAGNFEHSNHLFLSHSLTDWATSRLRHPAEQGGVFHGGEGPTIDDLLMELADSRRRLLDIRKQRVQPGRDDKVLTNWNALVIASLADAARITGDSQYRDAAASAARFVLEQLWGKDGVLLHTYRRGIAQQPGFLDDYAGMIDALTRLFEASGEPAWIGFAVELADAMLARFSAPDGGFFYVAHDQPTPLFRSRDSYDGSVPSGLSTAAVALIRLGLIAARPDWIERGRAVVDASHDLIARAPTAVSRLLLAIDLLTGPTYELVLIDGQNEQDNWHAKRQLDRVTLLPHVVVPTEPTDLVDVAGEQSAVLNRVRELGRNTIASLHQGKVTANGEVTLFVCQNTTCKAPAVGLDAIQTALTLLHPGTK